MDCCGHDEDQRRVFNRAVGSKGLRAYRRRGLPAHERRLAEALVTAGVEDAHVLEVGGGLGGIQVALLEAGAAHATNVDISSGWEDAAAELLEDRGLQDRVDRVIAPAGAGVEVGDVDVALAHRVVCCTADWRGVVDQLLAGGPRLVALTLPHAGWWQRALIGTMNVWWRVRRTSFRVYAHDEGAVLGRVRDAGFGEVRDERRGFWRTVLLAAA